MFDQQDRSWTTKSSVVANATAEIRFPLADEFCKDPNVLDETSLVALPAPELVSADPYHPSSTEVLNDVAALAEHYRAVLKFARIPSLEEVRVRAPFPSGDKKLRGSIVRGDVRDLRRNPANAGTLFQVASQFNLLEMVSPEVSPADGVARYAHDLTQGPAARLWPTQLQFTGTISLNLPTCRLMFLPMLAAL